MCDPCSVTRTRPMDNKIISFLDIMKGGKSISIEVKFKFLFFFSPRTYILTKRPKIQDDLPVNTYLIKL